MSWADGLKELQPGFHVRRVSIPRNSGGVPFPFKGVASKKTRHTRVSVAQNGEPQKAFVLFGVP